MNASGRNDRPFGLPSGPASGMRPGVRPPAPPTSNPAPSRTITRAERFEDEKRRIIESCFSKTEANGQLLESYITHIRIQEDAAYPQNPPPPSSEAKNKKERFIILAVRSVGRIQVHKARENTNGTFSVGKVWPFEDVQAVESYSSREPQNAQEAQAIQWAGESGFTVTIGKPYFWQASSAKEKEFFIASLIKIYRKYTQGQLPELTGFSPSELEQVLGQASMASRGGGPPSAGMPLAQRGRGGPLSPGIPPPRPTPSPDSAFGRPRPSPPASRGPAFASADRAAPNRLPSGSEPRPTPGYPLPPDSLRPGQMRQPQSRENLRTFPGQTPPDRLTPQASQSDLAPNRTGTPDSLKLGSANRRGGIFQGRPEQISREGSPSNALGISSAPPQARNVDGSITGRGSASASTESLSSQPRAPLPERRRPPMTSPPANDVRFGRSVPSPALRPGAPGLVGFKNATTSKPDSDNDMSGKMPGGFVTTPLPSESVEKEGVLPKAVSSPLKAEASPLKATPAAPTEPTAKEKTPATDEEAAAEKEKADELARPGLGRMFGANKKTTKDLFKSAATAYSVFKPRAGGAAAKLFAAPDTKSGEPDGITGVVPAPSLMRTKTNESARTQTSDSNSIQATPTSAVGKGPEILPDVKVTSPQSPADRSVQSGSAKFDNAPPAHIVELQQAKAAEEETARKKLRRTPQQIKYLQNLGVDPAILDGRGLEYEALLDEFWPEGERLTKPVEQIQAELRREITQVQTRTWLENVENADAHRADVKKLIERAISEIDDMDRMLTLFSVEIASLAPDVANIEAQAQGLQVQAANQKLLHAELKKLLDTIIITPEQLEPLHNGNILSIEGLESTERSVLALYRAVVMMNPQIKSGKNVTAEQAAERLAISKMRAVREHEKAYTNESTLFLVRLKNYMDVAYGQAEMEIEASTKRHYDPSKTGPRLTAGDLDFGRALLWKYSPLMLFAKELDESSWKELMGSYQSKIRPFYANTIRESLQAYQKLARSISVDDQEYLFTYNEDKPEGLAASTRKITVKRSQTLARTLRAGSSGKASRSAGVQSGSLFPCEAFELALVDLTPLVLTEQNFVVDFFHARTTEAIDFAEASQAILPESRGPPRAHMHKSYESDPAMIQFVNSFMNDLFTSLPAELQDLLNWATAVGPLQRVGILNALYKVMAPLDDNFLANTLHAFVTRITGEWSQFLNLQIRSIEDTKVKIHKRKGVIPFMKTFRLFSAHIEDILTPASEASPEVRHMVDQAYDRITKAMFESLRVIAKESPSTAPHGGAGDPEDKEALNYHILLIENMNYYVEHVEEHNGGVLAEGKRVANDDLDEHLSLYVDAVIRRPLGKIMDFTESLNHAIEGLGGRTSISNLASKPTFSVQSFKKLLATHDAKELRRGADALRKRVEKHFGDADDQETGRKLVEKVLKNCEERYAQEIERVQTIPKAVYGDDFVQIPVTRDDIYRFFKK